MKTTASDAGTERRLLENLTVTIGEVREVRHHPSGTRFNGPAVVVSAWTSPIFGLGVRRNGERFIPTGVFVRLVSLSDPNGREVVDMIAATTGA